MIFADPDIGVINLRREVSVPLDSTMSFGWRFTTLSSNFQEIHIFFHSLFRHQDLELQGHKVEALYRQSVQQGEYSQAPFLPAIGPMTCSKNMSKVCQDMTLTLV